MGDDLQTVNISEKRIKRMLVHTVGILLLFAVVRVVAG